MPVGVLVVLEPHFGARFALSKTSEAAKMRLEELGDDSYGTAERCTTKTRAVAVSVAQLGCDWCAASSFVSLRARQHGRR